MGFCIGDFKRANGTNMELLMELSKKKEEADQRLLEYYSEWDELQE